jgi:23S rRNA pseudouridine955/2504/2580 synthase
MEHLTVTADDAGMRFDRFLRQKLGRTPLSQIYRLIRTGFARVNGKKAPENHRLAEGDIVALRVVSAEIVGDGLNDADAVAGLAGTTFFKRSFHVLWEDECLLVCDKPANLVVHSGSGHASHDTLIDCATSYLLSKGARQAEPHLAHRIDKDTSGVVVLAKDKQTLRKLNEAFRTDQVHKSYKAICHGRPQRASGVIDAGLSKTYERNDGTKMRVEDDGVEARTEYHVERSSGPVSLLDVTIHTGRTHQIRVHMAHIGSPLVGDVRYGDEELDKNLFSSVKAPQRLYLHAAKISLRHPLTSAPITIEAPLPEAFADLLGACTAVRARIQSHVD